MSPTLTTFPALLFSVLAVTLQFVAPDDEEARALNLSTIQQCIWLSQRYLDIGEKIIRLFERQKPTTTSIEFYLVRMAWLKNAGRGSESWQCLGVALRQAQEIDLHQVQEDASSTSNNDAEKMLIHVWEIEHQKRLWAKIFIMDSHMAVALGRPRGIHREDCTTSVPLDCDYPHEPSRTLPVGTNHNRQPPNDFSHIIFSITLSHKYHDLMSMRASRLDLRDYTRVTNLHNDIECMLTDLPPALRPSFPDTSWDRQKPQLPAARQRILTTANIFLLALHRPYMSTHVASRDAALAAALAILQAQQNLFEIVPHAQHKLYGYSFYTIDAGILLTASILKFSMFSTDVCSKALEELQRACSRLACMKDRSMIAGTGEIVLRRCCSAIEAAIPSFTSTSNYNYLTDMSMMADLTTMSLFQELGFLNPDQATSELISRLDEPSLTLDSLPEHTISPSNGLSYNNNTTVSTIQQSINGNFTASDLDGMDIHSYSTNSIYRSYNKDDQQELPVT